MTIPLSAFFKTHAENWDGKMKTLKEAYESVGLEPKVGDILNGNEDKPIHLIEGNFYRFDDGQNSRWFYFSAPREKGDIVTISRNGKQIYPKVEEPIEEVAFNRERLKAQLVIIFKLEGFDAGFVTSAIEKLIDAKIKESKCNS